MGSAFKEMLKVSWLLAPSRTIKVDFFSFTSCVLFSYFFAPFLESFAAHLPSDSNSPCPMYRELSPLQSAISFLLLSLPFCWIFGTDTDQ